jgi:sulfur-carrier protein adenylyltransferase/sulfurtransferase
MEEDDIQIIDVREPYEYEMMNIGARLIPLSSLEENVDLIDQKKKVVVHCKSGARSAQAIRQLQQKFGFVNLYNLKGGIMAYLELK